MDHGSLAFERRASQRISVDGAATAIDLAGSGFGTIHELHSLDYSDGGMGAASDSPLAPGTVISIGFQQPGLIAQRGVVLRCMPSGKGYRLAIRFEGRLAA
jgi:hypothetical protein